MFHFGKLVIDDGRVRHQDGWMANPQVFWPYFALVVGVLAALATSWRELRKSRVLGQISIAIPMGVFGAEHLSSAHAIMNAVPPWMPWRLFWTYFVGLALIAAALSIIFKVRARLSASLLALMLCMFVVMIHIPNALATPNDRFAWTVAARDLSFSAGAAILGVAATGRLARGAFYAIAAICVFFGVEQLLHPECVPAVPLRMITPAWIPLGHFWTYLTGAAMVAGGVAMFFRSRRAALAMGLLVTFVVLVVYLPIMISKLDVEGVNYFADTLLFAGVVLMASNATGAATVKTQESSLAAVSI